MWERHRDFAYLLYYPSWQPSIGNHIDAQEQMNGKENIVSIQTENFSSIKENEVMPFRRTLM